MPKLDPTHIHERLVKRLEELEAGHEIAAKDIRALLTKEQQASLDAAWAEQQALRKQGRARTEEEQRALGWKSKRDLRIEAFKQAIAESKKGLLAALQKMQSDADVRQARIYFDTLGKAMDEGRDIDQAKSQANNALTRAGLRRMDGELVTRVSMRDKMIRELDQQLQEQLRASMSDEEIEQIKLLEEHEAGIKKRHGRSR